MRLLVWFILGVLVYLALRKKVVANKPDLSTMPPPSQSNAGEAMVACSHCQIFVPASEAIVRDEKAYCCLEHAQQSQ